MSDAFVLVHGAWHRGSCWAPVRAELPGSVAPDLPDGPLGASAYAAAVLEHVPAEGPVVVVGHSLGGLTAPLVAAALGERVRALVLLAAMVPAPGAAHKDLLRADPSIMAGSGPGPHRGPDHSTVWSREAARDGLYAGVAEEIGDGGEAAVERAIDDLRPQYNEVSREPCPLPAWPAVPTVSVVCTEDRMVSPATSRRIAAERGFPVVELPGGHFPMLTRPAELAELLRDLVRRCSS